MTVNVNVAKSARKYLKIKPQLSKKDAIEKADKAVRNVVMEGLKSVFRRAKPEVKCVDSRVLYHPFWLVHAASRYHYTRKDTYSFEVPPEVRSVKIGSRTFEASHDQCTLSCDATCFEHYEESVIQDATSQKGRKFDKYVEFDTIAVKNLEGVKDGEVSDVSVRASYVLNSVIPKIIRPINADTVIESKIEVDRLELWLVPNYIVTMSVDDVEQVIIVDGVTGDARKDATLISKLSKKYWSGETVFDISSEVAATFIPGEGVGMIVAKKAYEVRGKKKESKKREGFAKEFKKRKK